MVNVHHALCQDPVTRRFDKTKKISRVLLSQQFIKYTVDMPIRQYFIKKKKKNINEYMYVVGFPDIDDLIIPYIHFAYINVDKLVGHNELKFKVDTSSFTKFGKISVKINDQNYQLIKPKIALGTTNINNITSELINDLYLNGISLNFWLTRNLVEKLKQGFVPDIESLYSYYDPTTIKRSNLWANYNKIISTHKKTENEFSYIIQNKKTQEENLPQEYTPDELLTIGKLPPTETFKFISAKYQFLTSEDLMAMSMYTDFKLFIDKLNISKLVLIMLMVTNQDTLTPLHAIMLHMLELLIHKVLEKPSLKAKLHTLGFTFDEITNNRVRITCNTQNQNLKTMLTAHWLITDKNHPDLKKLTDILRMTKNINNLSSVKTGKTLLTEALKNSVPTLTTLIVEDIYTEEI
jgi:hypothetical protein